MTWLRGGSGEAAELVADDLDVEIAAAEARLEELLRRRDERRSAVTPRPELSLYPWQTDALTSWLQRGHKGVVEAVTGAGKTRVGIAAIAEARRHGRRAVVIVPSLVLLRQWATALNELLPDLTVSTSLVPGTRAPCRSPFHEAMLSPKAA